MLNSHSFKTEISVSLNIQSRITPLCHFYFDFVIKIQQSKITVNKSKDHSYFEEFTLWILIKHMNIHSRIKPLSPLYVCDKDSIQLLVSEATPIRGHTLSGPLLLLVRPPHGGITPSHWSCGGGACPLMPCPIMPCPMMPCPSMPHPTMPHPSMTHHMFFCTLLDFSKLILFFFHCC